MGAFGSKGVSQENINVIRTNLKSVHNNLKNIHGKVNKKNTQGATKANNSEEENEESSSNEENGFEIKRLNPPASSPEAAGSSTAVTANSVQAAVQTARTNAAAAGAPVARAAANVQSAAQQAQEQAAASGAPPAIAAAAGTAAASAVATPEIAGANPAVQKAAARSAAGAAANAAASGATPAATAAAANNAAAAVVAANPNPLVGLAERVAAAAPPVAPSTQQRINAAKQILSASSIKFLTGNGVSNVARSAARAVNTAKNNTIPTAITTLEEALSVKNETFIKPQEKAELQKMLNALKLQSGGRKRRAHTRSRRNRRNTKKNRKNHI
jgi:hypothetical protein